MAGEQRESRPPVGRPRAIALLAVGLAALAAVLAGPGGAVRADGLAHGRALYQSGSYPSCGFCHTLKSAGTVSPFASDLDQELPELKGSRQSRIRQVLAIIRTAQCFDPHDPARCMPKELLNGANAASVAAFLVTCAGHESSTGCRPPTGPQSEAAKGEYDFKTLGCASCHWANLAVSIAPPLNGLAGSKVTLANGKRVTADFAYLLASILTPDRDTVRGYPRGFMSSRIKPGQVSAVQAKAIVAYLKTLAHPPGG